MKIEELKIKKINSQEEFKPIKHYENYLISNYGRIFYPKRNDFIEPWKGISDLDMVTLYKRKNEFSDSFSRKLTVSRIVYEHFNGDIPKEYRIYFKDGDRHNLFYKNLIVDIQHRDRLENLLGKKFGRWVVIDHAPNKGLHTCWLCKCDCNKTPPIAVMSKSLTSGVSTSCGCFKNRSNKYNACSDMPKWVWSTIVVGAIKRGYSVEVSSQYAHDLLVKQNFKCAYTGLPIEYGSKSKNDKLWRHKTASFDRRDNDLGYIDGNCQWIHKDINTMKMDLDEKTFLKYCQLITENAIKNKKL